MRVLLVTQVVPNPPDAGPKVKTHYVLRTLAEEHEVDLLTYVRDEAELEAARQLAPYCRRILTVVLRRQRFREPLYALSGWARRKPFLVARDAREQMRQVIAELLGEGEIDVLHADQVSMAQYIPLAARHGVPTVFDAHNAVWQLLREMNAQTTNLVQRAGTSVEWRAMRRFEGEICRVADLTLAVSEDDRQALEEAAGQPIESQVIPIGTEVRDQPVVSPRTADGPMRLLSVATMHYPPNADALRWFRDEVWPHLTRERPDVHLDIVGPRPPADLVRWGEEHPGVQVHGYVEDLTALYESASVFIVPLQTGSGIRVKIIEAMARGVPVVSTSIGAAGLDVSPEAHYLLADDPSDFAAATGSLLETPGRGLEMATAARQRMLEVYDWRSCCRPVLEAYEGLARTARLRVAA